MYNNLYQAVYNMRMLLLVHWYFLEVLAALESSCSDTISASIGDNGMRKWNGNCRRVYCTGCGRSRNLHSPSRHEWITTSGCSAEQFSVSLPIFASLFLLQPLATLRNNCIFYRFKYTFFSSACNVFCN